MQTNNNEKFYLNNLKQNGCLNHEINGCSEKPSTSNGIDVINEDLKEKTTPSRRQTTHLATNNAQKIIPGLYYGLVKHFDLTLIPVKIEVSEVI